LTDYQFSYNVTVCMRDYVMLLAFLCKGRLLHQYDSFIYTFPIKKLLLQFHK